MSYIYIATTLDTKEAEALFVKSLLTKAGLKAKIVDLSTKTEAPNEQADINAVIVAQYHQQGKGAVFCGDRGKAISAMSDAFKHFMLAHDDVAAIIGLGGSGGTALITQAMQALPIGLPKLMVSTMASGDVSGYVGSSDIAMLYSVTDLAGINRISRKVLTNAAHQIAGAVYFAVTDTNSSSQPVDDRPAIGLTMFGVTTPCIHAITTELESQYDCIVFHATGQGGPAMEKLVDNHLLNAVIDITTTEVCDLLFDGVLACDNDRFDIIAKSKVPFIASCGALDMVNFGHPDSIPEKYRHRLFYQHNSQVTLMRTTAEENRQLGEWIGHKLNQCEGKVRFLIPLKGFSALDNEGQDFYDPLADQAFIDALLATVKQTDQRQIIQYPYHINDPLFAQAICQQFSQLF